MKKREDFIQRYEKQSKMSIAYKGTVLTRILKLRHKLSSSDIMLRCKRPTCESETLGDAFEYVTE